MLSEQYFQTKKHYGNITPIKYGYYRNPQSCMFGFTLILTITLSLVMIFNVFTIFTHRCISILLCLYIVYRFVSLGLSNPGLAVQSIQEEQSQSRIVQDNNILIQSNENQKQQKSQRVVQDRNQPNHKNNFYVHHNRNFDNYCNQCKIPTKRYTRHCYICKTCIQQFDHHCIWIGKCIGKKNMWQFKEFLCFTFGTLIYALVLTLQMTKVDHIKS